MLDRGRGTVLAFDFGTRRIGVAVGELETRIAHPLATIEHAGNRARFGAIERLVAEWRPVLLVVGLPGEHADGTPHPVTRLARRFARRLHGRFGIPTVHADERLSSREAEEALHGSGAHGRRAREGIDAVAAQRILERYFAAGER